MDDTEKYLNDILKKRLGSVVNYGVASKAGGTVARIPKQQQKMENMPTVFRKKHQTVYRQGPTQYSQVQSQYLSMKSGSLGYGSQKSVYNTQMPQQNRQTSNQRVEYMLISKRIQNKQQDQFISPTVDVTKYSKASFHQKNQKPLSSTLHLNGNPNTMATIKTISHPPKQPSQSYHQPQQHKNSYQYEYSYSQKNNQMNNLTKNINFNDKGKNTFNDERISKRQLYGQTKGVYQKYQESDRMSVGTDNKSVKRKKIFGKGEN